MNLRNEATYYTALRDRLLEQFPDLADDEQALLDTLEGETSLHDKAAAVVRSARQDEAMAKGIDALLSQARERKDRLKHRADTKRGLALSAMQAADLRKIEAPDLTISVAASPASVVITDESALPEDCWRVKREINKSEIKNRLKAGDEIAGAQLSNGGERLNVRGG